MTGNKIRDVLIEHRASSQLVRLSGRLKESQRKHLAFRLIEAYVEARCPVIVLVDSKIWWSFEEHVPQPHAITVIGVRGSSHKVEENALVCHDPGFAPYLERPFNDYFDAAAKYTDAGLIQFIVTADWRLATHGMDCIEWLTAFSRNMFFNRYSPADGAGSPRDYGIRLLRRDDLLEFLYPQSLNPSDGRLFAMFRMTLAELTRDTRYWCVSTCGDNGRKHWLFDAEMAPVARPSNASTPPIMMARVLQINVASPLSGSILEFDPDPTSRDFPRPHPYQITPT